MGCFGAAAISIAFVFGATAWRQEFASCGLRALLFSLVVILGLKYWHDWQRFLPNFAMFLSCHFLLPAAICWIRRVPIRVGRLLGMGIFSIVGWYAMVLVASYGLWIASTVIFDTWLLFYFQYPSLALAWALIGSFASAFMLKPLPQSDTEA